MTILKDWGMAVPITDRHKQPDTIAPELYAPTLEAPAPLDWFIRGEISKAKAAGEDLFDWAKAGQPTAETAAHETFAGYVGQLLTIGNLTAGGED